MDTKSADTAKKTTTSAESTHRLRVGDVFLKDGVEHVVWFLNESRASVSPLTAPLDYRTRESDGKAQFLCLDKQQENVSPNSELKIERSLGREGLAKLIDENKKIQAVTPMKKNSKGKKGKTAAAGATPGIRAGKLGTFEGFSVASVIRTLAKNSWNFAECKAFCDKEKIPASDQTIKLNIYRGTRGIDGEYAPLSKDQMPTKPKVAAAPEKKTAKTPAVAKNGKAKTKTAAAAKNGKVKTAAKSKTPAPVAKPERAAEQIAALKKTAAPAAAAARA